ncbi:prepilin-type N-terminal cleavage/methylation domain-containing protein [Sphingomonas sp. PL-96]|uniref:type II secretion system protein GspJ n=1 Tax=Sphingomonas sp. PL-96 TaxID=2887201 RepID=UPI001E58FC4E|nr:type II secretion system protein GspJ [Sphingomonas sp. PL-96]MCC2977838.1 prepilin-type N-terminal cleavage/methylation domain-containing protein [Sphingomonas sp. PL-96]
MTQPVRHGEGGFTLIELMISLGLFALIAVAGVTLVDSILSVQGRTEKRLDRIAEVQRAMFVVASDFDQLADGRVQGNGGQVAFQRAAPGFGGPPVGVTYSLAGGVLVRTVDGRAQRVLDGVQNARWRYFDGGWLDAWPPDEPRTDAWPRAVAVELAVSAPSGMAGTVRRVATLPIRPSEPK